ncbi:LolA family protein [Lishizhenia tianjinensis]|nr:outer membrane lipoprotein carrier protein LolA [Lishizhenia tianjinensis]
MMKTVMIAMSFLSLAFTTLAQSDEKSDAILKKLSTEMKALKSFHIEFDMHTKNNATGVDETDSGEGWVQGEKFYATLGENIILSNGLKIWTITEETVYITDADEEEDGSLNPKKLMTIWEEGFKSKYVKEENGMHVISLYPTNPDEVDYHTITLHISKADNSLKKAIMKTKDATTMTYTITKFEKNPTIPASKFVFNKQKHAGKEIIED